MSHPRIAFVAADTAAAQEGMEALRHRYTYVDAGHADVIVALGGDGFMLETLHRFLGRGIPIYGMNRGTVGFLMNDFSLEGLDDRLRRAQQIELNPLLMTARTVAGLEHEAHAINEVSLLRETRQAAKIEISIDGKVRLDELSCDGVLVSTPAGSTAYNLSAGGSILPLDCDLLALTALSPFRPRRWKGALVKNLSVVEFRILEAERRPVSAVADQVEVRDVVHVKIKSDLTRRLELLFDPEYALDDRILMEQFLS